MNWTIAGQVTGAGLIFFAGLFLFWWALGRIDREFGTAWAIAFVMAVLSVFVGLVAGATA